MRILFVDDEQHVLSGLRRMLHRMRDSWEMSFLDSAEAALEELQCKPYDVVVSDVRMPKMDGIALLTEVKTRYPGVIRIILSGQADEESMLRTVGPAHQYLAKPCEAEDLVNAVQRAMALQELVSNASVKSLVSRMDSLPSLPELYAEIMRELNTKEPSIQNVGRIVAKDIAMSAKVLQLVNSAFFGLRQEVSDPVRGVMYLGLDTLKGLALTTQVFTDLGDSVPAAELDRLWRHCVSSAMLVNKIAQAEDADRSTVETASQAAFLHDIGELVIAANLGQEYGEVLRLHRDECAPRLEAELRVLGTTHAEIGGYLLGLWGLPCSIVEAVAFHHRPSALPGTGFNAVTAVHVASALAESLEAEGHGQPALDEDYLIELGLYDRVAAWQRTCEELLSAEVEE